MPYIEPIEIERVRKIDLLTYLQEREPDELVRTGTNTYCTRSHDSLKISNGNSKKESWLKIQYVRISYILPQTERATRQSTTTLMQVSKISP